VFRRAAKQVALSIPPLRRVFEQRDVAMRDVGELRARLNSMSTPGVPHAVGDDKPAERAPLPGLHPAAAPQRYTDNYHRYIAAGGKMRLEDLAGFVRLNPLFDFDRTRFYMFLLTIDFVAGEKLPGDMAELGVDKGNSASVLAHGAERLGKTIYLLDTFEGFSERDLVDDEQHLRGTFADTSLDLVSAHVRGPHVRYVQGYFPDTAVQIPDDARFCLVHLDCDLYKPFASALEFFWPRLVPGGFLIMHDYTTMHWEGVVKAVDEFFATRPESPIPMPDMGGTVVVRKAKQPLP
jgi:O-methyltransferase